MRLLVTTEPAIPSLTSRRSCREQRVNVESKLDLHLSSWVDDDWSDRGRRCLGCAVVLTFEVKTRPSSCVC